MGTHFLGNVNIYTSSIPPPLRGPSPPGASWWALWGSSGAHNLLAGSIDRDFGALWEPLGDLLTASLLSRGLHSSKIAVRSPLGDDFELSS